jgi:DNA-binding response OmpR family regulator
MSVLGPLDFHVLEAQSGEDCFAMALAEKPDLILLDLAMGGMDGVEVTTRLRAAGFTASIIVVSANAYQSHRQLALDTGCDDFIAKPLQIDELLQKVKLHLSLDWIYIGQDIPPRSQPATPMQLPSQQCLAELAEFARIGDLRGLSDRLLALAAQDNRYLAFVAHLQALSKDFRLADIKRLLNRN